MATQALTDLLALPALKANKGQQDYKEVPDQRVQLEFPVRRDKLVSQEIRVQQALPVTKVQLVRLVSLALLVSRDPKVRLEQVDSRVNQAQLA